MNKQSAHELVHDDFFDFSVDILRDLVAQGYEGEVLIRKFRQQKQAIQKAMDQLIASAAAEARSAAPISKHEMEKEIGL